MEIRKCQIHLVEHKMNMITGKKLLSVENFTIFLYYLIDIPVGKNAACCCNCALARACW